jgi:GNAT superfamily N-acetyltransferase
VEGPAVCFPVLTQSWSWSSEYKPVIKASTTADAPELSQLYVAYRVFYWEAAEEQRAAAFILDRLTRSDGRYFLAFNGLDAIGFMHLMPSTNTLAMRPIWFLEDLYVDTAARGQGVATALLQHRC